MWHPARGFARAGAGQVVPGTRSYPGERRSGGPSAPGLARAGEGLVAPGTGSRPGGRREVALAPGLARAGEVTCAGATSGSPDRGKRLGACAPPSLRLAQGRQVRPQSPAAANLNDRDLLSSEDDFSPQAAAGSGRSARPGASPGGPFPAQPAVDAGRARRADHHPGLRASRSIPNIRRPKPVYGLDSGPSGPADTWASPFARCSWGTLSG